MPVTGGWERSHAITAAAPRRNANGDALMRAIRSGTRSGVAGDHDIHRAGTIIGRPPRRMRRMREQLAQRRSLPPPEGRRVLVPLRVIVPARFARPRGVAFS